MENVFLKTLPKAEVILILVKLNPVEMFSIVSQSKADRKYVDENDIWKEVAEIRYRRDYETVIVALKERQEWEFTPCVPQTQDVDYFRAMLADYLLEEYSFGTYARFLKIQMKIMQRLTFTYNSIPVVFACAEDGDDKRSPVELFSVQFKTVSLDDGRFSSTLIIEILQAKNAGAYRDAYAALMKLLKAQVQFKAPKTREIPETIQMLLHDNLFLVMRQVGHLFYRMLNIKNVYVLMKFDKEKTVFLKNKV